MAAAVNSTLLIKNSFALYARMLFTIIIGLYTSRVVLEILGVDDYGIYNIVGGIVGLTGFLNASMSSATSRFFTYELGAENSNRLRRTFCASVTIHLWVVLVTFFICETIGLWLVNYKLVLPEDKMLVANYVFQISIITTCLTIIQVPYTAAIMAHERMEIFAYIEILNSLLKLAAVWFLLYNNINNLIAYALSLLIIGVIIFLCYFFYCKFHFEECVFKLERDRTYLRPLLSYSGWDLFGNLSVTAKQQGSSIVLNLFHGVVANASAGIANIINGTILGFSQVSMTAFRPQIIKNYAAGQIYPCLNLIYLALKVCVLFYITIVVPVFICMDDILGIWLTVTPQYSSIFCRIMIISGLFNMLGVVFIAGIHATGNIRRMNIVGSICNLLTLIIGYIGYKFGASTPWIFWCFAIINFLILLSVVVILKQNISELSYGIVLLSIFRLIICSIIIVAFAITGWMLLENPYLRIVGTCIFSTLASIMGGYIVLLTPHQRVYVKNYIKIRLKRV